MSWEHASFPCMVECIAPVKNRFSPPDVRLSQGEIVEAVRWRREDNTLQIVVDGEYHMFAATCFAHHNTYSEAEEDRRREHHERQLARALHYDADPAAGSF